MQHHWGIIHETDVSSYAGTLILPEYMSYLQLMPFRFAAPLKNTNSGQNLLLTYSATGRLEELELDSAEHALNLLCHVYGTLDQGLITLPDSGMHWHWPFFLSSNGHPNNAVSDNNAVMKIYFEPTCQVINRASDVLFAPEKAYLSYSRKKLFIHQDTIFEYFRQKMSALGYSVISDQFEFTMTSLGFICTDQQIVWEWIPEWDDVFNDLLIFSGCRHWIDHLKNVLSINEKTIDINIEKHGVYVDISKSVLQNDINSALE